MSSITVTVAARSGKTITSIVIDQDVSACQSRSHAVWSVRDQWVIGPVKDHRPNVTQASVMEFKKAFAKVKRQLYPSRQRFSLPPAAGEARGKTLEDSSKLSEYGLKNGSVLQFKDLGPQVSDLGQ